MRLQTLGTWFGCCSLAFTVVACSSGKTDGGASGDGNGGVAGSGVGGEIGTSGGRAAGGTGGTAGTSGHSGGVSQGGAGGAMTGGSAGAGIAGGATSGSSGQIVGMSGAVVMRDGVTLDIPADALTTDVAITVTTTSAPAGYTLASEVFQFGPDGTTFSKPVAVTIPLTAATPGAHLFWSNPSGGFDDIGGTVNGLSVTAQVTHFSKGFCAVPGNQGGGGASGAGGVSGSAGATGTAGASSGGTAGSTAAGGASSGGSGGSGGAAGSAGAGGAQGGTGAGGASGSAGSAGSAGGSALCNTAPLNLPGVKVTSMSDAGAPPDSSTYTGGTLVTGTYFETGDAHYGGSAYGGPIQAQYKIDASAHTIQIGERTSSATYYIGMTYAQTDAHTLHATVVCNTSPNNLTTLDYDYTLVTGNPGALTLSVVGSADVMTLPVP
jgi:hypothetical protein